MEYLEGESLEACLGRIGSLGSDVRTAVVILDQIADALDAAQLNYTTNQRNCSDSAVVTSGDLRFELSNPDTGRAGHPGTKVFRIPGRRKAVGTR